MTIKPIFHGINEAVDELPETIDASNLPAGISLEE